MLGAPEVRGGRKIKGMNEPHLKYLAKLVDRGENSNKKKRVS